jgi:hypothetical protein
MARLAAIAGQNADLPPPSQAGPCMCAIEGMVQISTSGLPWSVYKPPSAAANELEPVQRRLGAPICEAHPGTLKALRWRIGDTMERARQHG